MADQQSELDARSLRSGRRRRRFGIVFRERNDDQSVIVIVVHGVTLAKTVRLDALKESEQAPLHWFSGMSGCGTFETCRRTLRMSAHCGRPEVTGRRSKRCY